jgi:hypothetical protein
MRHAKTGTATQDAQKGCPARPQQAKRRRVPLRYVKSPSDASTKLEAFFSILLEIGIQAQHPFRIFVSMVELEAHRQIIS